VRVLGFEITPPHPASPPKGGEENGIYGWTLTNTIMMNPLYGRKKLFFVLLLSIVLVVTAGCPFRFVADYDPAIVQEIFRISKKVDMFFGRILETPSVERTYDNFKDTYIEIEADLRTLLRRNEARPLNDSTIKQVNIALKLWLDDKSKHMDKNTVGDFTAKKHRKDFERVFVAMAKGEMAKDIKSN
jgi:hypothetical protein